MRLFHIASNKNAEAILKEGFRNGTGYYLTDQYGKAYREWLVDDKILNSYGPPLVVDDYDDDEIVPHLDPGAFLGDFDMGEFL